MNMIHVIVMIIVQTIKFIMHQHQYGAIQFVITNETYRIHKIYTNNK